MELKIAKEGEWRPRMLGYGSSVSSDILAGRDEEVGWEDIFVGRFIRLYIAMDNLVAMMEANTDTGDELRDIPDFHTEMEGRMKMNW